MDEAERSHADLAGEVGQTLDPLTDHFGKDPTSFGFFYAVRWLSLHFAETARRHDVPMSPPVSTADRPMQERLRFVQQPDLAFMPATIAAMKPDDALSAYLGEDCWNLVVPFFGLFGPHGPLPWHVTEAAIVRAEQEHDTCLLDFLNLFNHRAISLYYRAWAEHQMTVATDRGTDERFARYIGAFAGLDALEMRERGEVGEDTKLHYAGLLALGTRPAEGLATMLADYFECDVEVMPFKGRWINIPREAQCDMGTGAMGTQLGVDTVVGERVWEVRQCYTLRIGPLDMEMFTRLLPSGSGHARLRELVRLYVGDEFACEAVLVLSHEEARPIQLGEWGQLGYSTWVRSTPFDTDLDQSVIPVVD